MLTCSLKFGPQSLDPARAEQAVALVAQLQRNFDASRLEMQAHKDKLRVLYADYDSPRVEFEREFGAIQQEIQHVNAYFSRLSAELQSLLTSEEEREINKARSKYIESAINSLRAT